MLCFLKLSLESITMKNKFLLLIFAFLCNFVTAQNIQIHYDFGKHLYAGLEKRPTITATAEMFRADDYGSTFFVIDFDYRARNTGAYWEIARELCFWQDTKLNWLSIHIEHNGGCSVGAGSFNNCWLGGLTYSGHSKDYSKTWSLQALYKCIPGTIDQAGNPDIHNFQITGVWNIEFANGWCSHSGFADFWREKQIRKYEGGTTSYIFLSELQLWVNLNKITAMSKCNLSLGTELRLSHNLVAKGSYAIPTLAAKYSF